VETRRRSGGHAGAALSLQAPKEKQPALVKAAGEKRPKTETQKKADLRLETPCQPGQEAFFGVARWGYSRGDPRKARQRASSAYLRGLCEDYLGRLRPQFPTILS